MVKENIHPHIDNDAETHGGMSRRGFIRTSLEGIAGVAAVAVLPVIPSEEQLNILGQMTLMLDRKERRKELLANRFFEHIENFTEENRDFFAEKLDQFGEEFAQALKPLGFSLPVWKETSGQISSVLEHMAELHTTFTAKKDLLPDKNERQRVLARIANDFYEVGSAVWALSVVQDIYTGKSEALAKVVSAYTANSFRNPRGGEEDLLLPADILQSINSLWAVQVRPNGSDMALLFSQRSPVIDLVSAPRFMTQVWDTQLIQERLIPDAIREGYIPGISLLVRHFTPRYPLVEGPEGLTNLQMDYSLENPRPKVAIIDTAKPENRALIMRFMKQHGIERVVPKLRVFILNFGTGGVFSGVSREVTLSPDLFSNPRLASLLEHVMGHEIGGHAVKHSLIHLPDRVKAQQLLTKIDRLMYKIRPYPDSQRVFRHMGKAAVDSVNLEEISGMWNSIEEALLTEYPSYDYLFSELQLTPSLFGKGLSIIDRTKLFLDEVGYYQYGDRAPTAFYEQLPLVSTKEATSHYATFGSFFTQYKKKVSLEGFSDFDTQIMKMIEKNVKSGLYDSTPRTRFFYPSPKQRLGANWQIFLHAIVIPTAVTQLVYETDTPKLLSVLSSINPEADADSQKGLERAIVQYKKAIEQSFEHADEELWANVVGAMLRWKTNPSVIKEKTFPPKFFSDVKNVWDEMLAVLVKQGMAKEDGLMSS